MVPTKYTPDLIRELRVSKGPKSLSQQEFADILGISRALVNKMENGTKVVSRASNILLTEYAKSLENEAEVSKTDRKNTESTAFLAERQPPYSKPLKRVPFYDAPAAGGNGEGDMLPISEPAGYIDTGGLFGSKCEAVIRIRGNSMMSGFPSGCLVGLNRHYDSFIQPGELFVMETRSQRVFKRIYIDEARPDCWECYSDNKEIFTDGPRAGKPHYPTFFIPKEEVIRTWAVIGTSREEGNSIVIHAMQSNN